MLGREISRDAVKHIIISGEAMESYPSDTPFPSVLLFGTWHNQPLHVVMAYDESSRKVFVITAYWPDDEHFESNFKTRRIS